MKEVEPLMPHSRLGVTLALRVIGGFVTARRTAEAPLCVGRDDVPWAFMEAAERWAGVGNDGDIQTCSYRGQHPLLNPLPEAEEVGGEPKTVRDSSSSLLRSPIE